MANAGLKTLLQSKEIREAMDSTSGIYAQPAASRPLLGLGVPQALTKPTAVSFLRTEPPRSASPPNCCSLKRTYACTNLVLLSLADSDDATDGEASPGPCQRTLCPKDNRAHCPTGRGLSVTTPLKKTIQGMERILAQLWQKHSSPPPHLSTEEHSTWHLAGRRATHPL